MNQGAVDPDIIETLFRFSINFGKIGVYSVAKLTIGIMATVICMQNESDAQIMRSKGNGDSTSEVVPKTVPSITEIRKTIRNECFKSNLKTSLYYVLKDIVYIGALWILLVAIESIPFQPVQWIALPIYWILQGTMFAAIFVLGHDCGHGSFSKYSLLNDILGTLLHTFILVPFYPWKLSHRHHHKNTGNIDKEEIFYPLRERDADRKTQDQPKEYDTYFGFGVGLFYYLILGFSPRNIHHWNPFEAIFVGHVFGCIASLASLVGWVLLLVMYVEYFGLLALARYYLVPIYVFASLLVIVTFLQHNEVNVPWYADKQWNYVKGCVCSVDRNYGWAHGLIHNIGTHQIHHLFSKIPHYHLEEATYHFRKSFPQLVHICDEAIMPSFFRMYKIFMKQRVISNDAQIHIYK